MRVTALALATLLALGCLEAAVAQAPAGAKVTGTCPQCQQAQQQAYQQAGSSLAERRAIANGQMMPPQQAAYMPQFAPDGQLMGYAPVAAQGGDIQLAGHHHMAAANGCPPGAGQQYGPPWAGGGGYDRNAMYGYNHPGGPFSGGSYGYWGGAHRTPGYPHHHLHREYVGPPGPPTGQVAYPYYTVRGPRDFLMDNPPSIGR